MTPQIKHRIEQIRRGEVPEEYKRTKVGIVPEEWDVPKAKEVFESISDKKHDGTLEVLSATQDRGVVPRSQVDIDIKYDQSSVSGYKKVSKGDFVISLRSFQGGIEYSEYDGIVSPAYTVLKEKNKICRYFYKTFFKTDDYIKHLAVATYGIRDGKSISFEDFGMLRIPYPPLAEQEKIAEILQTQDKLIELQQKKIDELKRLKKVYLSKMFPKKGCNVPGIRFPGFTGAWEHRKLGDLCSEFKSGDFIRAEEIAVSGEYPVYGGNGLRGYTDRYNHEGDFALIGRQGALCGNMNYSSGKAYFTEHAVAVRANNSNDTRFLFYCFGNMNLGQYSGQSAQPGLAVSKLVKLETTVPSKPEQEQISATLASLDNLITLHQRKLEEEQKMKKALMQLLLSGIVRVNV